MNSDSVIRTLNRMMNDQVVPHRHRTELVNVIQHIRMQDQEIAKIRDDVSHWSNPDDTPPAAA